MKNTITAPPRAALAKDKSITGVGKSKDNTEPFLDAEIDLESNQQKPNISPESCGAGRGNPGEIRSARIKWASRTPTLASARKKKDPLPEQANRGLGMSEGKVRGLTAAEKVRIAGASHEPVSQALSVEKNDERNSPIVTTDVDPERSLRMAKEQLEQLQAEIKKYKLNEESHQEEIETYKRDLHFQNEQIQDQENAINRYQRDLQVMRSEFETTISDLLTEVAEEKRNTSFWSRKHEEVHREYMRTENDYRILQSNTSERDALWKSEWERKSADDDQSREAQHTAQKITQVYEEEVAELRRQVLELKHSISTSTRTEGQLTDDVFREKMVTLGHDMQNWDSTQHVTYITRPDLSKVSNRAREQIAALVPAYEGLIGSSKLSLIQSIVASGLVNGIFADYFVGLEHDHMDHLNSIEEYIGEEVSQTSANQWRATTLTIIRQSAELPEEVTCEEGLTMRRMEATEGLLSDVIGADSFEALHHSLRTITLQAVGIAHMIRLQRARFKVIMPSTDPQNADGFDEETMEDISAEDEQDVRGKGVVCVTFPALYKYGDENGENVRTSFIATFQRMMLCIRTRDSS
ncbi:MAG: hypothetical protein M1827_004968 [Pycnora praestabilis]|nr:MAG: hypothetical protein M1827_004968 [Pycnora praestabilis]